MRPPTGERALKSSVNDEISIGKVRLCCNDIQQLTTRQTSGAPWKLKPRHSRRDTTSTGLLLKHYKKRSMPDHESLERHVSFLTTKIADETWAQYDYEVSFSLKGSCQIRLSKLIIRCLIAIDARLSFHNTFFSHASTTRLVKYRL